MHRPDFPTRMQGRGGAPLAVAVARGFWPRFRGLMLRPRLAPERGLLLAGCPSVHTCFMRFALDVVYLDRDGRVVKLVPGLRPWRFSAGGQGAAHVLELAAGGIARLGIQAGERLEERLDKLQAAQGEIGHPPPPAAGVMRTVKERAASGPRQRGAAMIEFTVVGPVLTLLGLAVLQYGMLFLARNQINHAAFLAARAGSLGNARLDTVEKAYLKGLIPLYGGGRDASELAEAQGKAETDMAGHLQIELLNPTRESFDDWNDPALERKYGARAIRNAGLAFRNAGEIKANSGQNIQDANLIKLRITHGYAPKVPLVGAIYTRYLQWLDTKDDTFHTQLVDARRIPVVTHVTLRMQSDPVEDDNVSLPGMGNGGKPADPGDPPVVTTDPPRCVTIGCTVGAPATPVDPGGGNCSGADCPVCPTAGQS